MSLTITITTTRQYRHVNSDCIRLKNIVNNQTIHNIRYSGALSPNTRVGSVGYLKSDNLWAI